MKQYVAIVMMSLIGGSFLGAPINSFANTCPPPSDVYTEIKKARVDADDQDYITWEFSDQGHAWQYGAKGNMPKQIPDPFFSESIFYIRGGFLYCTYQFAPNKSFDLRVDTIGLTPDVLSGAFQKTTGNTYECKNGEVVNCPFAIP